MIRNNLLENKFKFEIKEPKNKTIVPLWITLFLLLTAINVLFMIFIKSNSNFDSDEISYFDVVISNVIFAAVPFIYFFAKIKVISLFCSNKQNVNMKILEIGLPVCACREALKTWQNVTAYVIPAISMYITICLLSFLPQLGGIYLILVVIMSFFISFDLTLSIYMYYISAKFKPDYISVNKHIYNMTLYTQFISNERYKK